jgi:transposase-like protein
MYIPMLAPASATVSIRHSAEFKIRVVIACGRPSASIASVALDNGVNVNLVHRWLRERRNGVVWADGDGRKYVIHSDEFKRAIVAYSPNRRGEHPQAHLKDFAGILQADAFAGYAPLYAAGKVREAACWAHVRHRFQDLYQAQASPLASAPAHRRALRHRERGSRQAARLSAG